MLIFDDTGFLKDGNASACVSRQYTGTAGKVTNCQVGVSLHLASAYASAAVDWRLFLPETWAPGSPKADPRKVARRTACRIPEDVGHVEKWQLALDMLDETRSWGIEVPLAVADAGYGDAAAFRFGLQARGLNYVVGISTTLSAQPGEAVPVAGPYCGTGRPPVAKYPAKPQSVKQLVIAAGRKVAKPVQWREGSRPGKSKSGLKRMYSRFVALRIRPAGREIRQAIDGPELPACWLLAEWPATEPEPVQFWLADLPADHAGPPGQAPLARRTRLPGDEADPAYMRGLVSSLERKNARTVAEQAGHDRPDRLQQLLNTCDWDADEVRDDVREFVIGHLGDQDAVLVVDDTGFLKRGIRSAGVQRQYTGMAGRVENSQVGTFLAYATDAGHTLIDRELYLPASWTDDREHCRAGPPWNAASQHVQSRPSARPAWSGSRPRSGWAARQTGGGSRRLSADRRVRRCESGQARLATTPAADASVMGGCGGIGLGQVLATRV